MLNLKTILVILVIVAIVTPKPCQSNIDCRDTVFNQKICVNKTCAQCRTNKDCPY